MDYPIFCIDPTAMIGDKSRLHPSWLAALHKLMKITEGRSRDHDNNFVKQSPSPMS